jgi:hypothetical protein
MAPCIPTYRPLFTEGRVAAAVAIVAVLSSLVLLLFAPSDDLRSVAVACAAAAGAH